MGNDSQIVEMMKIFGNIVKDLSAAGWSIYSSKIFGY